MPTPLVAPVAPVSPEELRITLDGHLGIRVADGTWIVINPEQPLMLSTATDAVAEHWRPLRTAWPTATLISPIDIALRFDVVRALPAKWRREPGFPIVSATIGDRPGWYPELWPAIERWVATRQLRRGRKPESRPERPEK